MINKREMDTARCFDSMEGVGAHVTEMVREMLDVKFTQIIVLNFFLTLFTVISFHVILVVGNKWFSQNSPDKQDQKLKKENVDEYEGDLINEEDGNSNEDDGKKDGVKESDEDLIAMVRGANSNTNTNTNTTTETTGNEKVAALLGGLASLSQESSAEALMGLTKQIAQSIGTAQHIPPEQKKELEKLMEEMPKFLASMLDLEDEQLQATLKGVAPMPSINKIDEVKRESDMLVKTLDELTGK
jgi:hypothetical protein